MNNLMCDNECIYNAFKNIGDHIPNDEYNWLRESITTNFDDRTISGDAKTLGVLFDHIRELDERSGSGYNEFATAARWLREQGPGAEPESFCRAADESDAN